MRALSDFMIMMDYRLKSPGLMKYLLGTAKQVVIRGGNDSQVHAEYDSGECRTGKPVTTAVFTTALEIKDIYR